MSRSKRPSLAETMQRAARPEPAAALPPAAVTPALTPAPTGEGRGFYAATRVGKKKVTAALDPAVHKELKKLATDREMTAEGLLLEAINDLFQKYGKPPIA
jgi:hypothetical protein